MDERFDDTDPHALIPALYDLEHESHADDVDLYLQLAAGTDGPILELGCGSGRLLLPLARARHQMVGLDSSPPMLARAEAAITQANLTDRVRLVAGSMVDAADLVSGPFGLVVLGLNSLLHVHRPEDQRRTLAATHHLLGPAGRLVLDLLNPHPDFLREIERAVQHEGSWRGADGGRVDKFAARRVFAASQEIETDLWYDLSAADGTLRRVATSYRMRYLHWAELALLLELTGFARWQVYGSYELDPFDDLSDRLLVIAEP